MARRQRKPRHRSGPVVGPEVRFNSRIAEVRTASDDPSGDVVEVLGEPIVYNTDYTVRDMFGEFVERMAPGVVSDILDTCDCRMLFNHDGMPLARTTSGTLTLTDGADALQSVARLDLRSNLANDLVVAIERQDVSQMSVGFIVGEDEWNEDFDDRTIRKLSDLLDVSAVTYPASPTTTTAIAQRMLSATPLESRSRIRKAFVLTRELREGKILSASNVRFLSDALDALSAADDSNIPDIVSRLTEIDEAVKTGRGAVSEVLDRAKPADDEVESADETVRQAPETKDERREAALSYGDLKGLVYEALQDYYSADVPGDVWVDLWIVDLASDWVIFEVYGSEGCDYYKVAFTNDATSAEITGDPVEVIAQTDWVPVPESQENDLTTDAEERDEDVTDETAEDREDEVTDLEERDVEETSTEDEEELSEDESDEEDEDGDEPDESADEDEDDEERAAAVVRAERRKRQLNQFKFSRPRK